MRLAALAASLFLAAPALANWQGTEWGEGPSATLQRPGMVEATAKDQEAYRLAGAGDALVRGEHVVHGSEVDAIFYYKAGGLSAVALQLDIEIDEGSTLRTLTDTYGKAEPVVGIQSLCRTLTSSWSVPEDGNRVEHVLLQCGFNGAWIEVRYFPLGNAADVGL